MKELDVVVLLRDVTEHDLTASAGADGTLVDISADGRFGTVEMSHPDPAQTFVLTVAMDDIAPYVPPEPTRWVIVQCDDAGKPSAIVTEVLWDGEAPLLLEAGLMMASLKEAEGLPMAQPEPPAPSPLLTAKQFFDRFTVEQRIRLRADPLMDDAERDAMAQGEKLDMDLASPRLRRLMDHAVGNKLLTRAEADRILSGKPRE